MITPAKAYAKSTLTVSRFCAYSLERGASMAERALLRRLKGGDEGAFGEIYGDLNPSMVRVATALVGNRATGEEVTQDTWMAVVAKLDSFDGRASLKNWIFAILANKARTRAKQDGRFQHLELQPDTKDQITQDFDDMFNAAGNWIDPHVLWEEITPERILGGKQTWDIVRDAIDQLPKVQAAILSLLSREKLSSREIAAMLEISEGNVRVHLFRAREQIRRILEAEIK